MILGRLAVACLGRRQTPDLSTQSAGLFDQHCGAANDLASPSLDLMGIWLWEFGEEK